MCVCIGFKNSVFDKFPSLWGPLGGPKTAVLDLGSSHFGAWADPGRFGGPKPCVFTCFVAPGSPKPSVFMCSWPLGARNHVFLRVFGPRGPETMCFYMLLAPGGPKPRVFAWFGLLVHTNTDNGGPKST